MQPSTYAGAPRRGCSPLAIFGAACGGCLLVAIFLAVSAGMFGIHAYKTVQSELSTPTVAPPAQYVGTWTSADGSQTLTIRADGRGGYHEQSHGAVGQSNLSIDGGRVTIDLPHKRLSITFMGFGKAFRLDQPPRAIHGADVMALDDTEFKRSGTLQPVTPGTPSSGGGTTDGSSSSGQSI